MEFQTNKTKPQPFALIPINAFDANKGDLTLTQGDHIFLPHLKKDNCKISIVLYTKS